jgi:hypothetical protein
VEVRSWNWLASPSVQTKSTDQVVSGMPEEYFIERLRAQEDDIKSLRATFEAARQRGNKKLMGISRKRLELALHLREMYQRMLKREGARSQTD